jgi:enoyl-CoA hydratase/carnithine racemase
MTGVHGRFVRLEEETLVAVVTVRNAPHNYVTPDLLGDLADALEHVDTDPRYRAAVLQTDGHSFSAGADLGQPEEALGNSIGLNPLYIQAMRLFATRKPIVAAIQGAAIGAGLGLALVADFRIAAPEARFGATFVALGFHPGFALTLTLPRVVGQQAANLMFLTGRRIKSDEALRWGLVDQVVELNDLRRVALSLASEIALNAPLALAATRATLRRDLAAAIHAQILIEDAEQKRLRSTEDFAEGIRAVSERRIGNFVGR